MPLHLQPGCPCQCSGPATFCNGCNFPGGFDFSGSWLTRATLGFSTVLCERSYPIAFPLNRYDTPEDTAPATLGYLNPGPDSCVAVRGFVAYWGYGGTLPAGLSCIKDLFFAPSSWECNISILRLYGWRITSLSDTAIRPRSQWCSVADVSLIWFDPGQTDWPAVEPSPPLSSFYVVYGASSPIKPLIATAPGGGWGAAFCGGETPLDYSFGFSQRGLNFTTYSWSLGGLLTPT